MTAPRSRWHQDRLEMDALPGTFGPADAFENWINVDGNPHGITYGVTFSSGSILIGDSAPAYYRDPFGEFHLRGIVESSALPSNIFGAIILDFSAASQFHLGVGGAVARVTGAGHQTRGTILEAAPFSFWAPDGPFNQNRFTLQGNQHPGAHVTIALDGMRWYPGEAV